MIKAALAFKIQTIRFYVAERKADRLIKRARKLNRKAAECGAVMKDAVEKLRQIKKEVEQENDKG